MGALPDRSLGLRRHALIGIAAFAALTVSLRAQDPPPAGGAPGNAGEAPQEAPKEPAAEPQEDPIADAAKKVSESGQATAGTKAPYLFRGRLSLSYRGRKEGGDNDEDIYAYFSLDGGREDINDISFHVFGRATYDLEGDSDEATNVFLGLNDVFGEQFDLKVYEAYVDLRRSLSLEFLGIERIRLGRQEVHLDYSYILDGARLDFARIRSVANLGISVYGGMPEFLYDSSRQGDWLAGVDLDFQPTPTTNVDVHFAHIQDVAEWVDNQARDDYLAGSVRQRIGEDGVVVVEWTTIDLATRDVSGRLSWNFPDIDLTLDLSYRYQNDVQHEYTTVLDPYFGVLGPSFAHHEGNAQLSKLFGEHFGADLGISGRILDDNDLEGPFNREYFRSFLTLSTFDWPVEHVGLSLTGEIWEAEGDDIATISFEVDWRATEALRFTFGTDYARYKYDLFVVDEREDAYTLFLRTRWDFAKDFRADARYEFETGDEGDFHTVWVGLTWSF